MSLSPDSLLQDKVCIITGGAGSIGLTTARRFLDEGGKVMLADLDESRLAEVTQGLDADRVETCVTDVSDAAQVEALVKKTVARFGKIDVLFSNAGNLGVIQPIHEYPEEVFDSVYRVHVKGAFLLSKYAVPQMNDGGSIIICSSVAGTRGDPGVHAYITAKHALTGLMRCLAKELAPRNIRANTINPGPVDNSFQDKVEEDLGKIIQRDATQFFNEHIPLGRHARPEEIANAVTFLASDQASFVTGLVMMADGGMSV